jgi:hypothetical protein
METLGWMPDGIVPAIGWLGQRVREALLEIGSGRLSEECFELAFELLDKKLGGLSSVLEIADDQVADQLNETCEELLERLFVAWDERCANLLPDLQCGLAKAYGLLDELDGSCRNPLGKGGLS